VIDCSTTPLLTCFNATRWLPAKMYFVQLYGGATPPTVFFTRPLSPSSTIVAVRPFRLMDVGRFS
jgi:hypothetical protein